MEDWLALPVLVHPHGTFNFPMVPPLEPILTLQLLTLRPFRTFFILDLERPSREGCRSNLNPDERS